MEISSPQSTRKNFDRRLFAVIAISFPLIVLAGFARTYYLKLFFHTPSLNAIRHLHGLLMTCWVTLFASQVALVSSRRISTHRRLGYAAIGLAIFIIVVGFFLSVSTSKFGSPALPAGRQALAFLIVPLTDLLNFALLFGAAIYYRKNPANHKRLMLLTVINFLPPAFGRLPWIGSTAITVFGSCTLLTIAAFIVDWRKSGKMNTVFLIASVLLICSFVIRIAVMNSEQWISTARWLTDHFA
jgi:hypothetical protein